MDKFYTILPAEWEHCYRQSRDSESLISVFYTTLSPPYFSYYNIFTCTSSPNKNLMCIKRKQFNKAVILHLGIGARDLVQWLHCLSLNLTRP